MSRAFSENPLLNMFFLVYGRDNVSSGASSDIISATRTASAMVKVCVAHFRNSGLHIRFSSDGVFPSLAQFIMTTGMKELVKNVKRK